MRWHPGKSGMDRCKLCPEGTMQGPKLVDQCKDCPAGTVSTADRHACAPAKCSAGTNIITEAKPYHGKPFGCKWGRAGTSDQGYCPAGNCYGTDGRTWSTCHAPQPSQSEADNAEVIKSWETCYDPKSCNTPFSVCDHCTCGRKECCEGWLSEKNT